MCTVLFPKSFGPVALCCLLVWLVPFVGSSEGNAQTGFVPNPNFEKGDPVPEGWESSDGEGIILNDAVMGSRSIATTGDGSSGSSSYWASDALPIQSQRVYRLQFYARRVEGSGGLPISGPFFANRDLYDLGDEWQFYTSYFVTPHDLNDDTSRIRFGQWEVDGTVAFDAVQLHEARPHYRQRGDLMLGEGERVYGDRYSFHAPYMGTGGNHSRPLERFNCFFNRPRWVFGEGSYVEYRHHLEGVRQTNASIEASIGYYTGGALMIEARSDRGDWQPIETLDALGKVELNLPANLFPADFVIIRFRALDADELGPDSDPGSIQLNGYAYHAQLEHAPGDLDGATRYVAEPYRLSEPTGVNATVTALGDCVPGGDNRATVELVNNSQDEHDAIPVVPRIMVTMGDGRVEVYGTEPAELRDRLEFEIPYEIPGTGDVHWRLDLGHALPHKWAETTFTVSPLYEADYGYRLPDSSDEVALWGASSGWKINRMRPAPDETDQAIRIQAARNEREAAQFVLRPREPLAGLRVKPQDLTDSLGHVLPADSIDVLQVGYVSISQPTDELGVVGAWPDPLPPINGPLDLDADLNHPFWVRVHTPHEQPAGTYFGHIQLEADGWQAAVPLRVKVFDFTLPERMTCETAFGFDHNLAFRYHNVTSESDRRRVYDLYLQALSDHHISPYDPAVLDPIQYEWSHLPKWEGGSRDTNVAYEGAASLRVEATEQGGHVNATYDENLSVPSGGLRIAFRYRTAEPDYAFLVTLMHYDEYGNWLRGRNNDMTVLGDGTWQSFETVVSQFPEEARTFRLVLWPTLYSEDASLTGTVWYDAIEVRDMGADVVLISEAFEPLDIEDFDEVFQPVFDWSAWDAAMTRAFEEYHFNTFRLTIPGMGGGTFHSRTEPSLLGYGEDTPEYHAAFTAWAQTAQEHLRDRSWLEKAYVYWFDEPAPDDYEFVMNGFRKLKEAAPDINRMLTEHMAGRIPPELIGGPNIWCPISSGYNHEEAEKRRAEGERFWWYVCTGPKAPYATLFIDHPATEMRVWLWQTWERGINGVLVWQTNYWTSHTAYPDSLQNPYEDPMSWVSGYGVPTGTKQPWGNGDGRFLYPPLAASDGNPEGPVFDAPVGSIRFEMLRDGIEDYEYMVILRDLIAEAEATGRQNDFSSFRRLLEVPDSISSSMTDFTWDPEPIEARRERIADSIIMIRDWLRN